MARTWTVRQRRLVHADLPSVFHWCTDERRIVEWQARMHAVYKVPIEWRETRDGELLIHEGVWRTRRGSQIRYWVTRHRPPLAPDLRTHEMKQESLSETLTPLGGRVVTEGASTLRLTAHDLGATEVLYEQSWRTVAAVGTTRIPLLGVFKLRRAVNLYLEQCALGTEATAPDES